MKRLLLDVDGVIADFPQLFLNAAEAVLDRKFDVTTKDITDWEMADTLKLGKKDRERVYRFIDRPNMAYMMNDYPGSVEAVKRLYKMATVVFVTTPFATNPTWTFDRDRWLVERFGKELGRRVIHTSLKYMVSGDVFVDDKPANVDKWRESHPAGIALLWDQPYNQKSKLPRAFNWRDVENMLKASRGQSPLLEDT